MEKLKKLYFSCPLTGVADETRSMCFVFREKIRELPGITILDFFSPKPGQIQSDIDDEEVYYTDIHEGVMVADLAVAVISNSFGVGYEMAVAIEMNSIPTLMCVQKDIYNIVSKIAKGTVKFNKGHVSILQYENTPMDVFSEVQAFIAESIAFLEME